VIDPGNRVKETSDEIFNYDDNGNMIGRTHKVTGETWDYIYDARNCMIEVQKNGSTVARYVYDSEGNRFKAIYPQDDGTNEGNYYHYDYTGMLTENPIVEETESGSRRNFVFLNRKLFARVDGNIGSGEKYWYMTDHLGSAHGLMDGDGTMVWWADYEAFGKPKGVGGPDSGAVDEAPRFTGKAWDEKIGLYYFNARWYDPELGRFVSEDPIQDGHNWYCYVSNDPLVKVDPLGLREDPGHDGREDYRIYYLMARRKSNVYVANTNQGSIESNDEEVIVKDGAGNIVAVYDKEQMKNDFQALANKQQIGSPDAEDFEEVIKSTYSAFFEATKDPSGVTVIGLRGWGMGTDIPATDSGKIKGETNGYDDMLLVMDESGNLSCFSEANFEGSTATGSYYSESKKRNVTLDGTNPSIVDGTYTLNITIHSGYYALTLNNDGKIPTQGTNPNKPDRNPPYADGIHIHKGGQIGWNYSEGCITIRDANGQWKRFISIFPSGLDIGIQVGTFNLMSL